MPSLKKRVDEWSHCGTGGEDYQASQQEKTNDNRQKPEFFPFLQEAPKLSQKFTH
jgi:hypothetical protein